MLRGILLLWRDPLAQRFDLLERVVHALQHPSHPFASDVDLETNRRELFVHNRNQREDGWGNLRPDPLQEVDNPHKHSWWVSSAAATSAQCRNRGLPLPPFAGHLFI